MISKRFLNPFVDSDSLFRTFTKISFLDLFPNNPVHGHMEVRIVLPYPDATTLR